MNQTSDIVNRRRRLPVAIHDRHWKPARIGRQDHRAAVAWHGDRRKPLLLGSSAVVSKYGWWHCGKRDRRSDELHLYSPGCGRCELGRSHLQVEQMLLCVTRRIGVEADG
jgi:hypothetical protein